MPEGITSYAQLAMATDAPRFLRGAANIADISPQRLHPTRLFFPQQTYAPGVRGARGPGGALRQLEGCRLLPSAGALPLPLLPAQPLQPAPLRRALLALRLRGALRHTSPICTAPRRAAPRCTAGPGPVPHQRRGAGGRPVSPDAAAGVAHGGRAPG